MESYLQERELLLFSVEKIYLETTNHVQFLKANLRGRGVDKYTIDLIITNFADRQMSRPNNK